MLLPALTTIAPGNQWRKKITEIKKLELKEIALFPTCLKQKERKELYQLLKETAVESIPFVHLRNDMELWELDYLTKNYKTKVFNTHPQKEFPFLYDCQKYQKIIYIENTYLFYDEKEIKEWAGICLDFSHLENDKLLHQKKYRHNINIIEKYGVGCCHISAIKPNRVPDENFQFQLKHDSHYLKNLSELDYLKNYPLKYFKEPIAVELENPIKEQLKAREYIINILKDIKKTK